MRDDRIGKEDQASEGSWDEEEIGWGRVDAWVRISKGVSAKKFMM
jgi:hypothetical protein